MLVVDPKVKVIVVPDDPDMPSDVPPSMREALQRGNMIIMSPDDLRMYVSASTWKALQDSYALTAKVR